MSQVSLLRRLGVRLRYGGAAWPRHSLRDYLLAEARKAVR
jgi:hypothetical protein